MRASDTKPSPPVEQLLAAMEKWGASDLFVSGGKVPAVRMHGAIVTLDVPATSSAEIERFVGAALSQSKRAQLASEGSAELGYALPSGGRFRLSVSRQLGVQSLFARAVPKADRTLDDLGLPVSLAAFAENARGLLVIAGATGSGRSTTLAALVQHINARRAAHIVVVEDPAEAVHTDLRARVTQHEIGADIASYAAALRQAAHEGADVIALGELASAEVARGALDAALRGQLVLVVVNAADASRALAQLVGAVPEDERERAALDLSLTLVGVVAQRLVPRADNGGRLLAAEVLGATHEVTQLVRERRFGDLEELVSQARTPGIVSFDAALETLCKKGLCLPDAVLAHASNVEGFMRRIRGANAPELGGTLGLDVHSLLALVTKRRASDLHLSVGRPPILRVDGRLETQALPSLMSSDIDALLRSIMSPQQRAHYARDKELDLSLGLPDGKRYRINAYQERGMPAAAFRAISSDIPDAASLGLPPGVLKMGEEPHGLLLVVGPTGSGKTTTLACLTDRVNHTRPCHIITIEDPIEYVHKSDRATIHQREVGTDTDSFAAALKYILRQDPDVVLIGELRDLETVSAALTAAETGHLVMATLHTNDAIQTIDRILDVFPPHQQSQARSQLASSLLGVVSQRLLPRADGKGRLAAFEVMLATPAIRTLIREAKMHQALGIMQASRNAGMVTMDQSLEELLRRGAIDKEEALRYMQNAANAEKTRPKAAAP